MKNLKGKWEKIVFSVALSLVSAALIFFLGVTTWNRIEARKYIGSEVEDKGNISVTASEEIYVKPDLAQTNFSVVTEERTVEDAMNLNSELMNKVIEAVKEKGVEEKDLKTIRFNISPQYEYPNNRWGGERVLVGYEVTQTLQVKIRDMDSIGEVIDAATGEGANRMGGLSFTIDDKEAIEKEARSQAIEKAKERAQTLSSQLGVRLGRLLNFSENQGQSPRFYYEAKDIGMGGAEEVPNVQTGENKVEVSVTLTYEIK